MVLKASELKQCPVDSWKNYGIDHTQLKLDIAKLVKILASIHESYQSKVSQLLKSSSKALINNPAIFDDSLASVSNLNSNAQTCQFKRDSQENEDVMSSSFSSSSTNSSYNLSSISLSNGDDEEQFDEEGEVDELKAIERSVILQDKLKQLTESYKEQKTKAVMQFLSSFVKVLKTVDLFINLKYLELVKNFQSNSNNFKRNHKNIITEVININKKLSEYHKNLYLETKANNSFLSELNEIKNNPDINDGNGNNQGIPCLNTEGIKLLNLDVVARNLETINNNNTKLHNKVDEFKNDLFLSLKKFIHFQKSVLFHVCYFLNKSILKSSKVGKYYHSSENNDLNDSDESLINYVDALYLVTGRTQLRSDSFNVPSANDNNTNIIIDQNFLKNSQSDLLLSFDERYDIFKTIFENFFGVAEFDEAIITQIVGCTVYEREFMYFGKINTSLSNDTVICIDAPTTSPKDASNPLLNVETPLNTIPLVHDSFLTLVSLSSSAMKFWTLDLSSAYLVIHEILRISSLNFGIYDSISELARCVFDQRGLVYNTNQLNYMYQLNNLGKHLIPADQLRLLAIGNESKSRINESEFDVASTKCGNSAWFLVSNQYIYEVRFLLDSMFQKIGHTTGDVAEQQERIGQLIKKIMNTFGSKSNEEENFDGNKVESKKYMKANIINDNKREEKDSRLDADECLSGSPQMCYFFHSEIQSNHLGSSKPVYVYDSSLDNSILAMGTSGFLGKVSDIRLDRQVLKLLNTPDLAKKLLDAQDLTSITQEINEYFHGDKAKFKEFQQLFNQQVYNYSCFQTTKERYNYKLKHPKLDDIANFYMTLYCNVKFQDERSSLDHKKNTCLFGYSLLEINWDTDVQFDDIIKTLVNSNYLYEVPSFSPFIYSLLVFGVVGGNGDQQEENVVYKDGNEELVYDLDWFHKITSRKFKLDAVIENRLFRTNQKKDLMVKLQREQQKSLEGHGSLDANKQRFNRISSLDRRHPNQIGKQRYWNEFDDNPEEWGSGGFDVNNGFYQDEPRGILISESIIDFLLNLSTSISTGITSLQSSISKKINKTGNNRVSVYNEQDSLLPGHGDYGRSSASTHDMYSVSDNSDEEQSIGAGMYGSANGNNGYGSVSNNYHSNKLHNDNDNTNIHRSFADPELERAHNHDIIATFLYFVLPTIAAIITGSSLGINYSIILNPDFEYSHTSYLLIMFSLVFGLIIAFFLVTISIIFLAGRIYPAPLHHYVWVWSVFIAVVLANLMVITEFVEV
ncbi:hypothetical protein DASC09_002300 [Saccharomycopsis crataegensis]|uniref:SPX domain-containing protein n=1 Tax=Saccharomycopsis crataegensis TaxID=43959 RepID=A0AAV5QD86_9ASCO|nr:hypothetical protein DASC09_002300 [Saccharomycopsis crataegensis]